MWREEALLLDGLRKLGASREVSRQDRDELGKEDKGSENEDMGL